MPSKDRSEYRAMDMVVRPGEGGKPSYMVDGYASTFAPYKLYTREGVDYYERIQPNAFDGADLSDVVFRVDHTGRVYARTSNGAVEIYVDDHGLGHHTDLSRSEAARMLFEDIQAGNYPKMSFRFVVAPGGDHYEPETHTRVIDKIEKVFDISPVSFPANPDTELNVSARDYFDGVIEAAREAERLQALELKRKRLKTKIKFGGNYYES